MGDEDATKIAIAYLKTQGYDIYEGMPDVTNMSQIDLDHWRHKANAWGVDIAHGQQALVERVRVEIERREKEPFWAIQRGDGMFVAKGVSSMTEHSWEAERYPTKWSAENDIELMPAHMRAVIIGLGN